MKLTQHGRYLWQLTRLRAFNCYLVQEEDGLTVVDTNLGNTAGEIVAAATQIGQPIRRVTLTHAHGDHVGSLDDLCRKKLKQDDLEIAFGGRTAAFLAGDRSLKPEEPQDKIQGGFEICRTEPTRLLTEGDMVGSLRVIKTPGHTPDHIAFYDEREGTLIAGDAFQTQAGTAVAGVMRWLFPFPAMATWHLPTAVQSARKLAALNPTRLAVGHGRVLETPAAAMQKAIATAEKKAHG